MLVLTSLLCQYYKNSLFVSIKPIKLNNTTTIWKKHTITLQSKGNFVRSQLPVQPQVVFLGAVDEPVRQQRDQCRLQARGTCEGARSWIILGILLLSSFFKIYFSLLSTRDKALYQENSC